MKRSSYPGLLLMESHGLAPNVRSTSFASVKVWSKLYQTGPYFLDLTLVPGDGDLNLRGEILSSESSLPEDAQVTLFDRNGVSATTVLGDGSFVLPLDQPGRYRLEVSFSEALLSVEGLDIG